MSLRILICDDHDMVRDALANVLDGADGISVITTCSSVEETNSYLDTHQNDIDVAVIDVRLQDGLGHDVTHWIKTHTPHIHVVLLTSFMNDELLVEAYTSGADAIVLKGSSTTELIEKIKDVQSGIRHINAQAAREASLRLKDTSSHKLALLDAVDREIAHLVAQGLTDREISAAVHFGLQTIKNKVSKILSTVGAANRTQLAVMVTTASLQSPPSEP